MVKEMHQDMLLPWLQFSLSFDLNDNSLAWRKRMQEFSLFHMFLNNYHISIFQIMFHETLIICLCVKTDSVFKYMFPKFQQVPMHRSVFKVLRVL